MVLPLRKGHEGGKESCVGGVVGWSVASSLVAGWAGQESFMRIHIKLKMSAKPYSVLALSWVLLYNHIYFSQSNSKVSFIVTSFFHVRKWRLREAE